MQFKDLQKSYQVYILYKGEKIRHKMGTVVSIANPVSLSWGGSETDTD